MRENYDFGSKKNEFFQSYKNNFIYKEYKVYNEDLEKIKEYGENKGISLWTVINSSLNEVFSRWSDGSGLKVILVNEENHKFKTYLGSKQGVLIDYKCMVDEKWYETCSRVQEEINKAFIEEKVEVSSIFSDVIEEIGEENERRIIILSNFLDSAKEEIKNENENDYCCHKREVDKIYSSEDKIPDAIIQCNSEKINGDLKIKCYFNKDIYTEQICNDMEKAHRHIWRWISKREWNTSVPDLLPNKQRETREIINSTYVPIKKKLLHQDFFLNAEKYPEREAILWDDNGVTKTMTYGELANKALKLAALLINKGVKQGEVVAITQPRGINQIVSALGILAAGAAYVPVGIKQPKKHRDRIYKIGGINHVIIDKSQVDHDEFSANIQKIFIKETDYIDSLIKPVYMEASSLAYVIFTSGSTGEPKGVEITHEAVYNTILDINTRFALNEGHRILNVSSFDFDLSVYDIFGMLSAGGGVVLLKEGEEREAAIWSELITRMKITVWNSVPALFDMLLTGSGDNMLPSLKLVLVSGDWVGLDLYKKLLRKTIECRFIALGGATEASIWSNYYEIEAVNPIWTSIPYGKPLSNQCFRVIDKLGRDSPDMIPGELWIGGMGVARGYIGNEELTLKSFVIKDGKRWYRTGDLGRYWSDGIIEFLGRADNQVKLRGFRIELGEIEAALKQYGGVGQSVAIISSSGESKHLVAAVVMENTRVEKPSLVELNDDIETYRSHNRENQCEMAEGLIAEILSLNVLNIKTIKEIDIIEEINLDKNYEPLLKMWLWWLNKRNVIKYENETIHGGSRLGKALLHIEEIKKNIENNKLASREKLISEIEQSVLEKLGEYKNILKGEESSVVLLDDEALSPESIAAKDSGTIDGIKFIADRIKTIARKCGNPVKVALIGARNGIMAEKLLNILQPCHIDLTLLDSASSLIRSAEERLSNMEHSIQYEVLKENVVSEKLRYSFDLALAINSLHRYHNPYEGVALASLLLKNGGKIFALEHCELSPIALVTAAVLDKGFKDLDHDRKVVYSPMLTPMQWSSLVSKAGFINVSYKSIEESFTEFIEGECSLERITLDTEELLNFVRVRLPEHMIPERIEILPSIPLTSNGKVNRRALEKVFVFSTEKTVVDEAHEGMEKEIEDIWKRLIGIERVNRNEGFFEIGGDSLLATRFISEVKVRLGVELSLRSMFEKSLLYQVASEIESRLKDIEQSACSMEEGEI
ncbi:amino acid adenylation domain-containing protein [Clostridium estertheticum]|uniref:amino acid adenylation domain-containing protein n=1 Tax=Clostridium estertheticum TaxID=238834 RepID=UPI001C0C4E6F|nr:amino acid adenylation domain-containing protein [Clostridium estertheticum]MBU3186311.1 amino acid adenylation domain-containing protein [Clostridium estertheticum]